jgi:hypothetical protein
MKSIPVNGQRTSLRFDRRQFKYMQIASAALDDNERRI